MVEYILQIEDLLDVPMFVPSFKPSVVKSAYSSVKVTPNKESYGTDELIQGADSVQ